MDYLNDIDRKLIKKKCVSIDKNRFSANSFIPVMTKNRTFVEQNRELTTISAIYRHNFERSMRIHFSIGMPMHWKLHGNRHRSFIL